MGVPVGACIAVSAPSSRSSGLIILSCARLPVYLIYTINQSPKRQGYHDVQAGTVVVKRG